MKRKDTTTERQPRRRYDAEFKASALRMLQNGQRISEVSRALGIGESPLQKWRSAARQSPIEGEAGEVERLRRQVKQLEMERDILTKALSIFSRVT